MDTNNRYKNSSSHYGRMTRYFHWTLFLLVTFMLILGTSLEFISNELIKSALFPVHKQIGLLVLTLAILWSLWSLTNTKPKIPETMKPWECMAARLGHLAIYILIMAMPLTGWLMSSAAGYHPKIFGQFTLVMPGIPKDKFLSDLGSTMHYTIAWVLFVLLCIHIFAALRHHFYDKDDVLKRMLPRKD